MKIEINLDLARLNRKTIEMCAREQVLLKNEVARGSNRYVPFLNGKLRQSVQSSINTPDPYLVYNSPYARYQYYGVAMEGAPPMHTTDRPLRYSAAGTGSQWFETWKASDGAAAIRRVKRDAGKIFGGRP